MYIAENLLAQGTAINPGHLEKESESDVNTKKADVTCLDEQRWACGRTQSGYTSIISAPRLSGETCLTDLGCRTGWRFGTQPFPTLVGCPRTCKM